MFEKMLGYANHVGLYAEEIGHCGEALGNFPQAFTHLGLISGLNPRPCFAPREVEWFGLLKLELKIPLAVV
jgi:hypothetical protein